GYGVVTAQTGIRMEALCQYLAEQPSPRDDPSGYALASLPAIGRITLGGALAIAGHGTGVPLSPDDPKYAFGSLSNAVLSIRAIVWDPASGSYQVRTFDRGDEDTDVVLTHLGHLMVTGVTLQVVPNFHLRCRSFTNISWKKLFHNDPQDNPFTVQRLLERHGRVNVIWFPYTDKPWLKIWDRAPEKPDESMATTTPYNYPFADEPSKFLVLLLRNIVSFTSRLIPYASKLQYRVVERALKKPIRDLWGPAWHTLLYVRSTTVPALAAGYAIHLPRSEVQGFLSDIAEKIYQLREQYAREGVYISCGPLEIRVTGLDESDGLEGRLKGGQSGISPPAFSPLTRSAAYSEAVDTAVWLDLLTLPSTISVKARGRANAFDVDLETWLFDNYPAAQVRVEWSKGWAYTAEEGAWHNEEVIGKKIPESFSDTPRSFEQTIKKMRELDPHNLFSNGFLDQLFHYSRPE
nr:cholesterol oxidase substrate-binding domain-containing protein [Endozoicomonas sp.]